MTNDERPKHNRRLTTYDHILSFLKNNGPSSTYDIMTASKDIFKIPLTARETGSRCRELKGYGKITIVEELSNKHATVWRLTE